MLEGRQVTLADFWHPIAESSDVTTQPRRFGLLGVDLVAFRVGDGTPVVLEGPLHPPRHPTVARLDGVTTGSCARTTIGSTTAPARACGSRPYPTTTPSRLAPGPSTTGPSTGTGCSGWR